MGTATPPQEGSTRRRWLGGRWLLRPPSWHRVLPPTPLPWTSMPPLPWTSTPPSIPSPCPWFLHCLQPIRQFGHEPRHPCGSCVLIATRFEVVPKPPVTTTLSTTTTRKQKHKPLPTFLPCTAAVRLALDVFVEMAGQRQEALRISRS